MTSSPKRILIVDDSDFIRKVVKVSLERTAGWEVFTARSGVEGLAQAEAVAPDAILLDMVMPDQDGLSVLRDLQALGATRNCPVIFLTAREQTDDEPDVASLGAAGIIAKPFDPVKLASTISRVLDWGR